MPSFSTIGSRIVIAAMVSMKQPTNRIRMFASSREDPLVLDQAEDEVGQQLGRPPWASH
jgi:hypothetical protein